MSTGLILQSEKGSKDGCIDAMDAVGIVDGTPINFIRDQGLIESKSTDRQTGLKKTRFRLWQL